MVKVINTIPNAFGAICLNSAGLSAVSEGQFIEKYFRIFTSPRHVHLLVEADIPASIGSSVDELMRHHPTLKKNVMDTIISMIEDILNIGKDIERTPRTNITNGCVLLYHQISDSLPKEETEEVPITEYIEVAARVIIYENDVITLSHSSVVLRGVISKHGTL
jgi:E3 ubiquitin-protein ligase HUWE1